MRWAKRDAYDRRGAVSRRRDEFASWGRGWKLGLCRTFAGGAVWGRRKRMSPAEEIALGRTQSWGTMVRSRREEQSWVQ